jgi:integrase
VLDVPPFLIDILAKHTATLHLTSTDLLFRSPEGGPLRASNFRNRVFNPAVRGAGLTGVTFHTLRQSAAGLLREVGAQELVVQHRLGHADRRTTSEVYDWVTPATNDRVTDALEALFGADPGDRARQTNA